MKTIVERILSQMSRAEKRLAKSELEHALDIVLFFNFRLGLKLTDSQVESVATRIHESL